MSNTALHTDKAPAAIGPYSQGIQQATPFTFPARSPLTRLPANLPGRTSRPRRARAWTNISNILAAAGAKHG